MVQNASIERERERERERKRERRVLWVSFTFEHGLWSLFAQAPLS